MADVNIDAELVQQGLTIEAKEELVELSNGCICCTLREDLLKSIVELVTRGGIDYIVVEGSGISEPLPVAETFTFVEPSSQRALGQYARLDTLVTVVDGFAFLQDYQSEDLLCSRGMGATNADERTLAQLLADQIEFSNVILVNKCDRLSDEKRHELMTLVMRMNPAARVFETSHGNVDLSAILNTRLFSIEKAEKNPQWLREARYAEHVPETIEYVHVCS
jgi:G3E family GTPase